MIDLRPITLYVTTDQWVKLATYASEKHFSINDAVIEMFEYYGDRVSERDALREELDKCRDEIEAWKRLSVQYWRPTLLAATVQNDATE